MTDKTAASTLTAFTSGDLVISVYGDGDGSGSYTDNQAAPITLEELTTAGAVVGQMVLPQTTTTTDGVTENAISGEYGSSSEGTLELSGDGHSLVLAGYGINAATYNSGGAAVYGNAALAQTTSVMGGTYAAVSRVIADIGADGSVDTSTALYNVFNTNNPRSVATVDGSSFYIAGQGVSGDTTQGVFLAHDGAGSATAIDNSTDARTVEIHDGQLYVSRDSKQGTGGTSSVASYGTEPTTATAATPLTGINGAVTLTAAQENSVNPASVGKTVHLSPENYFFANDDTLYIADSGNPKEGGLGDGGLQKWTFNGTAWKLDYTLSAGLNLVSNKASAGTTGLIGLTGVVVGNTVQLYATNATVNDLDQTYLFGITDTLGATTNPGESFTTLMTAAPDTNIRGIAFAPSAAPGDAPCYCRGTLIRTGRGEVAVEDLQAGDIAVTREAGREVPVRIVWIGQRRVDIASHPHPELVRPIRFEAGALGDGLPARPLRLSPDHALLLDGMLIAARQLVNGRSICVEPAASVHYYHVELERHGILLAEGVEAESYLDTGNRNQFANGGGFVTLHADFSRVGHPGACAGLVTEAARVQPVWKRLAERAGGPAVPATTREAELRLVLPDGRMLEPHQVRPDGGHVFWLAEEHGPVGTVRLNSRHDAPADIHPWLDDRRQLGVAVGGIRLWTRQDGMASRLVGHDSPALVSGWWNAETDGTAGWRWTNGDAVLAVPAGCLRIDVMVVARGEYVREGREARASAA